jgi:hypothetical protein
MDWIANLDNETLPELVDFAHGAPMSALLAKTLVGNSSRQERRSMSMDVE